MVAAIGGIGGAQSAAWGRPPKDPQQVHLEASKKLKEKSQPAKVSAHLQRTLEQAQSGEKSVHMQAIEDRLQKAASGEALSVHMQAIAERVEKAARGEDLSIHMQATLKKGEGDASSPYDAQGANGSAQAPGSIIKSEG